MDSYDLNSHTMAANAADSDLCLWCVCIHHGLTTFPLHREWSSAGCEYETVWNYLPLVETLCLYFFRRKRKTNETSCHMLSNLLFRHGNVAPFHYTPSPTICSVFCTMSYVLLYSAHLFAPKSLIFFQWKWEYSITPPWYKNR
jgi:hypothetical protein